MKTKNISLLAAFLFVLMVAPFVSSATTIVSPGANTNHTGTLDVNCTTDLANTMNSSFKYNATGVSNATLVTVSNDTSGDTEFSQSSVDISGLTEATDYKFWCVVTNSTGSTETSSANSGITIDNTNPSCEIGISRNTLPWKGIQEIDWTSSDSLELVSTTVEVDGPEDFTTQTYTGSSDTISLESNDTAYRGDWTTNITATDRSGNTCTQNIDWKTYLPGDDEDEEPQDKDSGKGSLLVLLVVIGIAAYFWFNRK